ncbi:ribonuclease Z [Rhodohalobacter barkolensis]|uniref:Ribonuclease Z n=1 Tax=Rhodohalobacter barkolensis TaxID=2053187 RepID=A0A2N0VMH5_9BACT|nr:ribonuclease Z [Rhodohalobacter barkolensis]PKD45344.1 ribonuclease Z [Rhodohalobacter barkolensis]
MIIVPLGVASATPTATRHLSSVALWREGDIHLFDCGENAQMRMLQAGLKRSKIENIFISHFDVDHYSGLIGLISTLQLQRRDRDLTVIGPKGIKEFLEFNFKFANLELSFGINYVEVEEDIESERVVDTEEYYVEARPLNHTKFCLGYRFQEKDKPGKVDAEKAEKLGITEDEQYKALKAGEDVELEDGTVIKSYEIVGHPRPGDSFAYITDTKYCPNSVKLAMNTNILYHEATFSESLADKAAETGHSTSNDAARVANEAQTKLLVISHFSARYTNPFILLREAREKFFPAWLATELRPIFTNPAQEKGIVQQKVYIKEIDDSKSSSSKGSSSGRSSRGSSDRGKKNFRKRKSSSGRGRSSDRSSSSNRRSRSDQGRKRKDRSSRDYSDKRDRRDQNDQNEGTSRPPKHITPRTPFDDFDRF